MTTTYSWQPEWKSITPDGKVQYCKVLHYNCLDKINGYERMVHNLNKLLNHEYR